MKTERYALFEYESGANPYVAFDKRRVTSIKRKYKRHGILVERVSDNHYLIHDKVDTDDIFWDN